MWHDDEERIPPTFRGLAIALPMVATMLLIVGADMFIDYIDPRSSSAPSVSTAPTGER